MSLFIAAGFRREEAGAGRTRKPIQPGIAQMWGNRAWRVSVTDRPALTTHWPSQTTPRTQLARCFSSKAPRGSRCAFGFRSPEALVALAMLDLGGLCPPLPGRAAA
jgi:hypothetical protein